MLYIPAFNGIAIFGSCQKWRGPEPIQVMYQDTAVPGANGKASIPLGERGYYTMVEGRLFADTEIGLRSFLYTFQTLNRATFGYLSDPWGVTWPAVRLETFKESDERWSRDPGGLGFSTRYSARFEHLVV